MTAGHARQVLSASWWQDHPMTYDWHGTLGLEPGSREWYDEIDRRFLGSAYYARGVDGQPFGRFLPADRLVNRSVLEVGCGMGTHAGLMARAGARVTAIDLTPAAVEATRRRFELFGLPGRIEQADCEHLPFDDASFDFVWTWGVIHHSNSTERCVAEIARVLRPGGRIVAMVYHRRSLLRYLHGAIYRGILHGDLRHFSLDRIVERSSDGMYARFFTAATLRAMLAPFFSRVSIAIVGNKTELLPMRTSRLKSSLERRAPDCLARLVLGRCGSMIVATGERRRNSEAGHA